MGEVRRAIGSTLESGGETHAKQWLLSSVLPQDVYEHSLVRRIPASSKFCLIASLPVGEKLLANTAESVERIVYLTGFSGPSTFYRAFKRWTNETPVEYRKRKQR